MGMIVNGHWSDTDRVIEGGSYLRPQTMFRSTALSVDKQGRVPPERYTLFISLSCPWCHRVTLVHALKKLGETVPVHIVGEPRIQGYALAGGEAISVPGLDKPVRYLHELYTASVPDFTGRSTIPVLWDNQQGCIVNNESADLLPMFNTLIASHSPPAINLYPEPLHDQIDTWSRCLYDGLNNAVYEAGFAESQQHYETAVRKVFKTLDALDHHFAGNHYLTGEQLTLADCRLYPTLVRFDPVYHSHFKCSLRQISDYPNITRYLVTLNQMVEFRKTVDLDAIRFAYFYNDRTINPHGIVPLLHSNPPPQCA